MTRSVLFVPLVTERAAPTRVRITRMLPYLERAGIKYRIMTALSDWTTRQTVLSPGFSGFRRFLHYLNLFLEPLLRLPLVLFLASRYRLVFIQRTTYPFGLERLIRLVNPRIVFDFDDAIFMADPGSNTMGLLDKIKESFRASSFEGILKVSSLAVGGNEFLRERAAAHCPRSVVFYECIDVKRYRRKESYAAEKITIGWIGSPSTSAYLRVLDPVLVELQRRHGIRVKLVGANDYRIPGIEVENHPWSEGAEAALVESFDIGLHPTPSTEWAEGKWGTKTLQYMAAGVPVVVSYTRANAEMIKDEENGFIARAPEEWLAKIEKLILDQELRRRIGEAGYRTVVELHSLEVRAPQFIALLEREFKGS